MEKKKGFEPIYLPKSPINDVALATLDYQGHCAISFWTESRVPQQITPGIHVAGDVLDLHFALAAKGLNVGFRHWQNSPDLME